MKNGMSVQKMRNDHGSLVIQCCCCCCLVVLVVLVVVVVSWWPTGVVVPKTLIAVRGSAQQQSPV